MTLRDIGLAVLAAVIWGATFPITRIALDETPPLLFTALRFSVAALCVVAVPRPAVSWPWLFTAGGLLGAGQYGFLFVAMERGISPGLASLLVHTQALFTVAIAWLAFDERLNRRQWIAIVFSAAGLGVLSLDQVSPVSRWGLTLVLTAAVCAAAGNNVLKRLKTADKIGVAVWMSVIVPAPLLALSALFDPGSLSANLSAIGWTTAAAVAYSAFLATIGAFAIWGRLLARYPASQVAPFFLLVPIFGVALSVALLGETLSRLRLVGGGLIFFGLVFAVLPGRRSTTAADRRR